MQKTENSVLYSAGDLVNFMGCAHATKLDLRQLAAPVELPADDEQARLLQDLGLEHERRFLERLRSEGRSIIEIDGDGDIVGKADRTRAALRAGPDVIFQGAFLDERWQGYSDFLLKVDRPSRLGSFSYEVADTKLARSARPKHILQMCIYSELLAREQGIAPRDMHVVLGNDSVATVRVDAVIHYFEFAKRRFLEYVQTSPSQSVGAPCSHCTFCRWTHECEAVWEATDDLGLVAGLTRGQADALRARGLPDMSALAAHDPSIRVDGIGKEVLRRLTHQARLQLHQRSTGERMVELLPTEPGRGFERLPRPDAGDMFFDMEGDPLFDGGLEYLFGIVTLRGSDEEFHPFWAHDRDEERLAFQRAVDFMTDRLRAFPQAHIYHYASYEETALKRLAMFHGTRENEVDDLLREHKLVDLYRVVREAIRTSEPGYSIKNMERFYLAEARDGDVTTAGDSIVMYERWRQSRDERLLAEIEEYNRIDCSSTLQCRDWFLRMRGQELPWFEGSAVEDSRGATEERTDAEQRVASMTTDLLEGEHGAEEWRLLLVHLLEFHRRESKPAWWGVFSRQDLPFVELLEDAECLAGLEVDPEVPPRPEKRSIIHTFRFPAQDFKLKVGDKPKRAGSLEPAGEVMAIDEDERTIELKLGPSRNPLEDGDSLIPSGPIGDKVLRAAVYRFAEAVRDGRETEYGALVSILRRDPPRFSKRPQGESVIREGEEPVAGTLAALEALQDSHLLLQGPPGAGKTYTASRVIAALLQAGKRVAVASNGHKAINQLLREIEEVVTERGIRCRGIKKSSREDQLLGTGGWIEETFDNDAVTSDYDLVAGTAWLFARPEHDRAFDYLFVDEAGQVGLANAIAMGVAAANVVLVGDQMQLAQPVQGTHPGDSGVSALQHLLQDHATVPPERGIFLQETRRMHPDLCGFVSVAVYDGRLRSAPGIERQFLLVNVSRDPEALAPAGLRFVDVDSFGCTQRSQAEAERLAATYRCLVGEAWIDALGEEHTIGTEDILVVSPYNMQVEMLKRALPQDARVGTVDKFQGQEAPVVLISMATSSGDDLPRNIEFLYSLNRLNVAVSRARCLSVIFANPRLLEVPCNTIDQMKLVNGLCWARRYAEQQRLAVS